MILAILYCVIVYGGFFVALSLSRERAVQSAFPIATASLLALVGVPSLVQFALPGLLDVLERNWPLILQGQVWRLFTSLVVQDGGWQGALFNLTSLVLLGFVSEKLWGARRLMLIFGLGGVITIALAFWWQPIGAGNSVANMAVAAATALLALKSSKQATVRYVAMAVLAAGGVLLLMRDVHGISVAVGACLGLLFTLAQPDGSKEEC